jgi:hypothetical protein
MSEKPKRRISHNEGDFYRFFGKNGRLSESPEMIRTVLPLASPILYHSTTHPHA